MAGELRPPEAVCRWRDTGDRLLISGHEIFVHDSGPRDAPPVMLLHGFPGSSFDWAAVVAAIEDEVRPIVFDFLGFGLSAKPPDGDFSPFSQADLVERVARSVGIDSCVLVSHDMGDTVAAELLHRATEGALALGFNGVILTNGSIFIHEAQLTQGQLALLAMPDEPLADRLDLAGLRAGLGSTFPPSRQPAEEILDSMVWLLQLRGGDRLLARLIRYIEERRRHQDRWTGGLVAFNGSLTALWGELDPIAMPSMPRRLGRLRPETEVVVWPDVGHWPAIEVPDRVAAAILALVDRH